MTDLDYYLGNHSNSNSPYGEDSSDYDAQVSAAAEAKEKLEYADNMILYFDEEIASYELHLRKKGGLTMAEVVQLREDRAELAQLNADYDDLEEMEDTLSSALSSRQSRMEEDGYSIY